MSDSIQYGSFRNPLYRDYEKFPYGTLENTLNSPPKNGTGFQQQQNQRNQTSSSSVAGQGKSKGKSVKDSCPFCKEQKKRPLGAYMRKRGQRITTESISEDAEEDVLRETDELQDDSEGASSSCSSPSGSPSAAELATGEQQQHNHHHHRHGTGYGRQLSQDSGYEAK